MTTELLTLLTPITVTIGVAFVAYSNYRSDRGKQSQEIINNYSTLERQLKEQRDDLEKKLLDQQRLHSSEINELHKAIGEKDATIRIQAMTIDEYKTILANRNPDLEQTLKEIRDFMVLIHGSLERNQATSTANADELHHQSAALGI